MSEPIRVLIVDDHALFREGLARLLALEPDLAVVGQAARAAEARDILARETVDVVLLDVDLGDESAYDFLMAAKEDGHASRFLLVTAGLPPAETARFLASGAAGVFLKLNPPSALVAGIRRVMQGESFVDARCLADLARHGLDGGRSKDARLLTTRQAQVLRGVFEGRANKEIAEKLGVSESAIKATLQSLFDKMGVRTRGQIVRIALEQYRDLIAP